MSRTESMSIKTLKKCEHLDYTTFDNNQIFAHKKKFLKCKQKKEVLHELNFYEFNNLSKDYHFC